MVYLTARALDPCVCALAHLRVGRRVASRWALARALEVLAVLLQSLLGRRAVLEWQVAVLAWQLALDLPVVAR